MYVKIFTLFVFISAFFIGATANNEIDVVYKIPDVIQAGSDITVNVSINKNKLDDLGRFTMQLPNGFNVIEKKSANGEFRFQEQKVIIQWLKLPFYQEELEISFLIQINPTVQGYFVINGSFEYIENEKLNRVDIYPHVITVNPISTQDTPFLITSEKKIDVTNIVGDEISCIRQKPFINENEEIIVNILVTKKGLNKFGKIQEQIPVGYNAVSLKSNNSIFVFNKNNRIVKLLWMNLPSEPQFIVSYKLISTQEVSQDAFIITGTFFYAESNTSSQIEIVERNVEF